MKRSQVMAFVRRTWIIGLVLSGAATASIAAQDPRVVNIPPGVDANQDRIVDQLEKHISSGSYMHITSTSPNVDLIVALDHAPGPDDRTIISHLGGEVLNEWSDLVYAIQVSLPPAAISVLAKLPGVVLVDENPICQKTMYFSTRQTRARTVWAAGYEGSSSHTIAVIDTGVDNTHPDLAGRVVAWKDCIGQDASIDGDEYATPVDMGEHGTHVSGTIAGSGAVGQIATGTGQITTTITGYFPLQAGSGYQQYFPVDTTGASGNSTIDLLMVWGNIYANENNYLYLLKANSILTYDYADAYEGAVSLSYPSVPPGTMAFDYNTWTTTRASYNNDVYAVRVNTPMSAAGDGKNLMRGMAPGCNIAGVKVLADNGSGTGQAFLDGLTWVGQNKTTYNIVAANMSLGFSSVVPTIDTAVDNLISQGVMCVVAAGNSRSSTTAPQTIGSPGTATKCITVAAISDLDQITNYSCYGTSSIPKPDVAAPGGSFVTHRQILSIDSNSTDSIRNNVDNTEHKFPDIVKDDYKGMQGTSMACPHVAGLVGLMANAIGTWDFTEANALRVKMLISMTSTETNLAAESGPNPTLDRGVKDISEGYGRINADAAIEAYTQTYTLGTNVGTTLGNGAFDKKAWARKVSLNSGTNYKFTLTNPTGGDFDLYLYKGTWSSVTGSVGDPIIAVKSTLSGAGTADTFNYTPTETGVYYVVVKRVSGSGAFTFNASLPPVTYSSPSGFVRFGWNAIGLPADPVNGAPASVLAGIDLVKGSLQYWMKNDGGGWQSYGSTFGWTGPLERGNAYWFLNFEGNKTLQYSGYAPSGNFNLEVPAHTEAPFWITFGTPFPNDVAATNVTFKTTSITTAKNWVDAYTAKMVDSKALGYDATTSSFFTAGVTGYHPDRTSLQSWYGYWLLVQKPEALTITFQKP